MSQSRFYVVDSPKVQYVSENDVILASYDYQTSHVDSGSSCGWQTESDSAYKDTHLQNQLPYTPCRMHADRVGRQQWKHRNSHGSSEQA